MQCNLKSVCPIINMNINEMREIDAQSSHNDLYL